jgi:epoxide hydrolase-like predicted phosphatase
MIKIKAVIFDVGGVLIRTEDPAIRHSWEKELELDKGESEQIVFNSDMGRKAQMGMVTDAELWNWVGRHLGLSKKRLIAFRRGFWAGDVLDGELVNYIRRLRTRYQTAIISNATDILMHNLENVYEITDAFDLVIGSATEGIMKPSSEIYELTLARLGRQPDEAVFIDDFIENVSAAREIGMHTIHFKPGMDVPSELAQLGVD